MDMSSVQMYISTFRPQRYWLKKKNLILDVYWTAFTLVMPAGLVNLVPLLFSCVAQREAHPCGSEVLAFWVIIHPACCLGSLWGTDFWSSALCEHSIHWWMTQHLAAGSTCFPARCQSTCAKMHSPRLMGTSDLFSRWLSSDQACVCSKENLD